MLYIANKVFGVLVIVTHGCNAPPPFHSQAKAVKGTGGGDEAVGVLKPDALVLWSGGKKVQGPPRSSQEHLRAAPACSLCAHLHHLPAPPTSSSLQPCASPCS